jgi:hypothetical protein
MDGAVYFLWHFPSNRLQSVVPDVIRHTALRSSDFPPRPFSPASFNGRYTCSQVRKTGVAEWAERSSGPAAYLLSIGQETHLVYAVAWLGGLLLWGHRKGINQQRNTDEERDNPD